MSNERKPLSSGKPTSIRLPPEIEEAVRASAEANRRSVSQEIIFAVEQYLGLAKPPRHKAGRQR